MLFLKKKKKNSAAHHSQTRQDHVMRTIDVAPLPLSDLEGHLDEVAVRRLHDGVDAAHALLGNSLSLEKLFTAKV